MCIRDRLKAFVIDTLPRNASFPSSSINSSVGREGAVTRDSEIGMQNQHRPVMSESIRETTHPPGFGPQCGVPSASCNTSALPFGQDPTSFGVALQVPGFQPLPPFLGPSPQSELSGQPVPQPASQYSVGASIPMYAQAKMAEFKIKDFWKHDPDSWFAALEAQYHYRGVLDDELKFWSLLSHLSDDVARQVSDVVATVKPR